ncbi:phospholipid transfer protein isoform X3 [Oreochromis niloticus]|uniref:phospholipid transfer protein isoform X3 n=1 Tax=Oreochromis niloticus TaxID=8128 RepID=UPI0009058846|nr:phospholipid transfer protein isoform X3 [Oreochromis niloticus]
MGFWLRMKSCVVIFFLVSLISSDTAAPPPGIKVRITEKVKDLGLMYLKGLVNREFLIENEDFLIKSVTLTKLQIDPAQVDFRFQDKIGLQFEIRDLNFALQLQREKNVQFFKKFKIDKGTTIFTGEGVRAMILVRMNQNPKGHLNVEIGKEDCKINADSIRTKSTGFVGKVLDKFKSLTKHFFKKKICPALQPMINDKLKDLSTMRTVHEGRQLDLDYSLSSDIAVTSRSLDMSFKGLMSVRGQAVDTDSIRPGKEPVFTETNKMIYVGISEFFFNGAAMAIYKSGPFEVNVPKLEGLKSVVNLLLGAVGIQPSCKLDMNVKFEASRLIPVIKTPKCNVETQKIIGKIVVGAAKAILYFVDKWFDEGIPIPLPTDLSFIDAKTQFEEGYLVVGGSLNFIPLQSSSNAGG